MIPLVERVPVKDHHRERTPTRPFGATTRQWGQAWNLASRNVLPYIDDPPGNKMPQRYMPDGSAQGFVTWQRDKGIDVGMARELSRDPRHGIGIMCREVRAIDVDFKVPLNGSSQDEHDALVQRVMAGIFKTVPELTLAPLRWRPKASQYTADSIDGYELLIDVHGGHLDLAASSGSFVLLYRLLDDELAEAMGEQPEPVAKRVLYTPAGAIELAGDGNYQVLAGRHDSGQPQLWRVFDAAGMPHDGFDLPTWEDLPALTKTQVESLIDYINDQYPDPRNKQARKGATSTALTHSDANPDEDPVLAYMESRSDPRWRRLKSGVYSCSCPNETQHTNPSADKPDTTIYMPEGFHGAARGFKCMHAHCAEINVGHFLESIGYSAHTAVATFAALPAPIKPPAPPTKPAPPKLTFNDAGTLVIPTQFNVNNLIEHYSGMLFANDIFTGRSSYALDEHSSPKTFDEGTTNELYHRLVTHNALDPKCRLGFIKDAVSLMLMRNRHSSAADAIGTLEHDGIPRLDTWLATALGEPNTPYLRVLGIYMVTGIVGRLLEPGHKVDITPIFYGPTGMRKSTLTERLALKPEWACTANLENRDKELMNQLLGKCVVELPELRGFNTRDAEGIKAWLTMSHDNFRLPYMQYSYDRPRQFITIGTTNDSVFLTQRLSLRRFAPVEVVRPIDTDFVTESIEQLYAEAIIRFRTHGLPWAELEHEALPHAKRVCVLDPWDEVVAAWVASGAMKRWTTSTALQQALGIPVSRQTAGLATRIASILKNNGCELDASGSWSVKKTSV